MAESTNADLKSGTQKENFDRLMSLFCTGTEIKQRLLEFYISKKELNLIDWLSGLSNNFLQFEDVKRAHRRSSTVQSTDLGDNTINTVFMCYCFEMFWDCCLLDTCLEGLLNIHKDELYRSYVNSQKQPELHSVPSKPYNTYSPENSTPIITKDQWEFLFKNGENEKCLLASNEITVSCLDNSQNIFILNIVCSLFKAIKAVSECQIQISKIAALQCNFTSNQFIEMCAKMEAHIVTIGKNCANSDIFQSKCARIRETTYNRSLVQENRKYILQEALNNPSFIRDRNFCNSVRKELDLITDEENFSLARTLCGSDISVTLIDGKYRKGAYSLSVIEKAEDDLQKVTSVCSKRVPSTSQTETEEKTLTDVFEKKRMPMLYIYKRESTNNYLKLVQLITNIAKNVLVDVLKRRLPATNLGFAFNGMKNRVLPLLNSQERQVLYPDNSYYKGDLSDLDISLIYTIFRNLNTLCPHKTGWGNMPKDDDRDMSANIERIRIFKNVYVSHHPTYSLNEETFQKTWTEISACIIELGGTEYIRKIDYLLTSEINPVMETELFNTLARVKESDRQHERYMFNFKADLDELKQQLNGINRNCATCQESSAKVPLELKIEGEDIPSVQEIEKRTKTFSSEYVIIKSIKEGSIIIGLDVVSSALSSLGFFLEVIEYLLSTVLQRIPVSNNDSTSHVIISLDFMDKNNESLVYRKPLSDIGELMEICFEEKDQRWYEEMMRCILMNDRQEFPYISHYPTRYMNVGNNMCILPPKHVYGSPNKKRDFEESFICGLKKTYKGPEEILQHKMKHRNERQKRYGKQNKIAKLLIEAEGSLTAKMFNAENIFPPTSVPRITPGYSDKIVHVRVQQEQETKSDEIDYIHSDFEMAPVPKGKKQK